ncbi:MAG: Tat pathway signal sequence domain protein, partial [Opitutaceae bacterium]
MSITPAPGALTRRAFVRAATVGSAAVALPSVASTTDSSGRSAIGQPPSARAHWLEGSPRSPVGARWGMAWPRGTVAPGVTFGARTDDGTPVSLQSWPLATWPDGSVKWSAHAVSADAPSFRSLTVQAGELPVAPAAPVSVVTTDETIDLTTGDFSCRVQRRGRVIVA